MDPRDLDTLAEALPPDLRAIISAVGFAKVAQTVIGVDGGSEHSVYAKIGTELYRRRKEAAIINRGLSALNRLGEAK